MFTNNSTNKPTAFPFSQPVEVDNRDRLMAPPSNQLPQITPCGEEKDLTTGMMSMALTPPKEPQKPSFLAAAPLLNRSTPMLQPQQWNTASDNAQPSTVHSPQTTCFQHSAERTLESNMHTTMHPREGIIESFSSLQQVNPFPTPSGQSSSESQSPWSSTIDQSGAIPSLKPLQSQPYQAFGQSQPLNPFSQLNQAQPVSQSGQQNPWGSQPAQAFGQLPPLQPFGQPNHTRTVSQSGEQSPWVSQTAHAPGQPQLLQPFVQPNQAQPVSQSEQRSPWASQPVQSLGQSQELNPISQLNQAQPVSQSGHQSPWVSQPGHAPGQSPLRQPFGQLNQAQPISHPGQQNPWVNQPVQAFGQSQEVNSISQLNEAQPISQSGERNAWGSQRARTPGQAPLLQPFGQLNQAQSSSQSGHQSPMIGHLARTPVQAPLLQPLGQQNEAQPVLQPESQNYSMKRPAQTLIRAPLLQPLGQARPVSQSGEQNPWASQPAQTPGQSQHPQSFDQPNQAQSFSQSGQQSPWASHPAQASSHAPLLQPFVQQNPTQFVSQSGQQSPLKGQPTQTLGQAPLLQPFGQQLQDEPVLQSGQQSPWINPPTRTTNQGSALNLLSQQIQTQHLSQSGTQSDSNKPPIPPPISSSSAHNDFLADNRLVCDPARRSFDPPGQPIRHNPLSIPMSPFNFSKQTNDQQVALTRLPYPPSADNTQTATPNQPSPYVQRSGHIEDNVVQAPPIMPLAPSQPFAPSVQRFPFPRQDGQQERWIRPSQPTQWPSSAQPTTQLMPSDHQLSISQPNAQANQWPSSSQPTIQSFPFDQQLLARQSNAAFDQPTASTQPITQTHFAGQQPFSFRQPTFSAQPMMTQSPCLVGRPPPFHPFRGPPPPTETASAQPSSAAPFQSSTADFRSPFTTAPTPLTNFGHNQFSAHASPSTTGRLNVDQLPCYTQIKESAFAKFAGTVQPTLSSTELGCPPPSVVLNDVTFLDTGNCSPRFVRSTLYAVPTSADLTKHLPLALAITPMADQTHSEEPLATTQFPERPVRCMRCQAYMCASMKFIDGGRRFQCPMCDQITETPEAYFAHTDFDGRRTDHESRPELCRSSYEIVATAEYCKQGMESKSAAFIFLLDVTYAAVRSGLLKTVCDGLMDEVLAYLPKLPDGHSPVHVCVIAFDSALRFFRTNGEDSSCECMVVSDISKTFLPDLDQFLIGSNELETRLRPLLAKIPSMFEHSQATEASALASAIEVSCELLKQSGRVGKLFVLNSSVSPQCSSKRNDQRALGTDREKNILTSANRTFTDLGLKCVETGCSTELFLFPNQFVDVSTLAEVCRLSSGHLHMYRYFSVESGDSTKLLSDLRRSVQRTSAYDAILRVRTGTGLRPTDFIGNVEMRSSTDVEFGVLDADTNIVVEMKHDDKIPDESKFLFQVALLYTNVAGKRIIRVHNFILPTSSQASRIFQSADYETLCVYMAKVTVRSMTISPYKTIRQNVLNQLAQILVTYRNVSNGQSSGAASNLVLPETLKLMPVLINSLLKSDAIAGTQNISIDAKAYRLHCMAGMTVPQLMLHLYPALFSLSEEDAHFELRCWSKELLPNRILLLDNAFELLVWIGKDVDPVLRTSIVDTLTRDMDHSNNRQPAERKLQKLLLQRHDLHHKILRISAVIQDSSQEVTFKNQLVEDSGIVQGTTSYPEFLLDLHREIRAICGI